MPPQCSGARAETQTPSADDWLREALRLAACGLRTVPLCGRRPARKGWQSRLSLDHDAIAATFSAAWNADGIAVACGLDHFALDVDRNHGDAADGVRTLAALIRRFNGGDCAPFTVPRVLTPRGGLHLHFREPLGLVIPNRRLGPGLECKGIGGLLTCPPTPGYRWACSPWQRPLALARPWLLDLVCPPERPRSPPAPVRIVRQKAKQDETEAERAERQRIERYAESALQRELSAVKHCPKGSRNMALFKASAALGGLIAGRMLAHDGVVTELRRAAETCGLVHDDGEKATRKTIASGLKRGRTTPRSIPTLVQGGRR